MEQAHVRPEKTPDHGGDHGNRSSTATSSGATPVGWPAALIGLQHALGNRAVAWIVQHQRAPDRTPPKVQRQDHEGSAARPAGGGDAVVVLGRWSQQITIPGRDPITLPAEGSRALLRGQAVAVLPGHEAVEIFQLPGAFGPSESGETPGAPRQGAFPALGQENVRDVDRTGPPGWRGLPSGVAVQEALEGGLTIQGRRVRAIYLNVDRVDLTRDTQTSSEYRQVVAALASGRNTEVDIVVRHGSHTSIVRRGRNTVEGDPLPASLRRHLSRSFATLSPGGGRGGGGRGRGTRPTTRPSGSGARTPAPRTTGRTTPRGPVGTGRALGAGAAGAGAVAVDFASIYLEQWVQERFIEPQNQAAFEADLQREQPRIDRRLRHHRDAAQRIRTRGGVPHAVVTLHVVYRTLGMDDGLSRSSFQDLWVHEASVEEAPREGQRGFYEGRSPAEGFLDPEALGRSFRNETHTLITYSYGLPDSGVYARLSVRNLAERLVDMHRYLARLTAEGEVPEEAVGIALEMRDIAERTLDLGDPDALRQVQEELVIAAGGDPGVAADVIALVRTPRR